MFPLSFLINGLEGLACVMVAHDSSLVHEAFGSIDIPVVPVEAIYGGLECLGHDELLQNEISGAPIFDHICNE